MYTSFILLGIAWFLLTGNWLIFGAWIAAAILVLTSRLGQEETMLIEEFGEEYQTYLKRTGRFLPGL